jgi:Mg2+-importing ATPase
MAFFKHLLAKSTEQARTPGGLGQTEAQELIKIAQLSSDGVLGSQKSSQNGLTKIEVQRRLRKYGLNEVVKEKRIDWLARLGKNFTDPLSLLLFFLAIISFFAKDMRATVMIGSMVVLSVLLRFFQETKADKAAAKLKAMVHTTAKVQREGKIKEIAIKYLVPGDIIKLSAGDMIPADIRLLESKDLFINQAALTGESLPAEKHAQIKNKKITNPLELTNLCFLGTNVEIGTAKAIVIATGQKTYLSAIAASLKEAEIPSAFDRGIKKFTWLIMKFIFIMVPAVFVLNGISKGNWFEAFIFSLAVAVGLAPEMLPMIVTVNLSKGALDMSRKKVIVKHLDSIQNFGAMNILCTDKTGTITQGKVILEKYLNIHGEEDLHILKYAYLNSFYQTGLSNLMDAAIVKHEEMKQELKIEKNYKKIDEIPFDFRRRRMSVVVANPEKKHLLICKGATEEVLSLCTKVEVKGKISPLKSIHHQHKKTLEQELNEEGFRVVAVAYKTEPVSKKRYSIPDEKDLTLLGFLAFLDPPKESAGKAIKELEKYGVSIKILTGDNELVTRKICQEVGLPVKKIILGNEIDNLDDERLAQLANKTAVFAKLAPFHKERIIKVLRQKCRHVVGFLGDGINDAPALRAADVGLSVDTAADIAKESSDIILLEKSLLILKDGVKEGRKIFGNVVKYIQMAASSNFGNMFSVVGASIFLPFLPMLPIQVLTNNLLYDISQTSIPTDQIDEEYLTKPRQWRLDQIRRFILYIGPISSIFDYLTYFMMLWVFNCWANPALFHTGWFVESLLSQTLIIYIIRTNKIPFLQSRPSWPLTITTLLIATIGIYLPFSPLANTLGFVSLPSLYWLLLLAMLIVYGVLTQVIKAWFIKKYQWE